MLFLSAGLGLAVGIVIGALGGGGGVLTVPLLVYVLGLPAQDATTSSIIIVGVTALVGTLARIGSRVVDWRTGLVFGALGVPAAYAGTLLNHRVDPRVLLVAFGAVTIVAAAGMLLNRGPDETAPSGGAVLTRTRLGASTATATRVVLSGLVVGFLTGFLGVGGGFLAVPALMIVLRMRIAAAVGTSLFVIVLNAVSSMAFRLGTHLDLDWRIVVPFTVAAVAGCLAGKRVANRFSGDALTRAFAVMLILVGGSVAAQSLGLF